MATSSNVEYLLEVQELNRAFLGLLQARLRESRPCFDLPPVARQALKQAPNEVLAAAANFPRALFRFAVVPTLPRPCEDVGSARDDGERDLVLSMLLAARHASRQNPYQARVLYLLADQEIETLRPLSLADVQRLANARGTLQCAHRDWLWLWQGLFAPVRPELRRRLTLMALQPSVTGTWPRRRPPRASA